MVANGLDLQGRVSINATPAISQARRLAGEFTKLSAEGKAGSAEMAKLAQTFKTVGAAANAERASIAGLAKAQAAVNKQMAEANVIQERAAAIKRGGLANAYATRQKGKAIASGAQDASAVAEGRVALLQQKGLTEEVLRTARAEEIQGRAALRAAQIQSISTRDQIAQQRLLMSAQRAQFESAHVGAERAATSLGHVGSNLTHIGVLGTGAFIGIVANAVVMEKQFAAVVRTSELAEKSFDSVGQKSAAIGKLRSQFDALAQELPVSYKELTEIGAAANQLGIRTEDLASFTKSVAQFSATTGVSVDTASTAFGRLNSLVTDVTRNGQVLKGSGVDGAFQDLADSINRVGVKSVATDQQIINIASQIAGIANAAGLGYKEIVGFSGALASVAVSPYLARGATTRLFTNINNAVAQGGDKLEEFAKVAGLSASQFSDAWSNDPQRALVAVFDGINKSGKDAVNVMADLGIKSVLDQPALLRVAKLADNAGNAGKGLAQSFYEAAHAAEENQKQYSIIANTVQGRLQIALNRTQILLRNIGDSDLGPLGTAISNISAGILHLSQNLDKPAKLFGQFNLPFTNGQLLGTTVALIGMAGAFTLGVGLLAKFGAALIRVRTAGTFLSGVLNRQRAATTEVGAASGAATAEIDGQAAATTRLARASIAASEAQALAARNRALSARSAASATPTAFPAAQAAAPRVFAVDSAGVASIKSTIPLMTRLQAAGSAAGAKVAGALRGIGGAARVAGGAVSSLVGGPAGLIALAAVAGGVGIASAVAHMQSLGTSAGDVSIQVMRAKTSMDLLANTRIAKQDPIGAIFDQSTVSVGSFITSTDKLGRSLEHLGSGGAFNDFASKFTDMFTDGRQTAWFNTTTAGLDKLDAGFQSLADSGNVDGAVLGIQKLFKGQSDTAIVNGLAHMSDATGILQLRLQQAGLTAGDNNENLLALAKSSSVLGGEAAKVAAAMDYQAKAFNGDTQAAAAFSEAQGKLVDGATDLSKAYSDASAKAGKGAEAGFGAFIKQAKSNYKDFVDSQRNALKIATDTGVDFASLSTLPAKVLAEASKNKLNEQSLVDAMGLNDAGKGLETGIAAITNSPKLSALYASLGPTMQKKIVDSLSKGVQIGDAFKNLGPEIAAAYQDAVQGAALDDVSPKISALKAVIQISGNPLGAIQAGESAKKYVDGLKGKLTVLADSLPATKEGESAAQYISRIKPVMDLLGNNAPAKEKGEDAKHYLDRLKGVLTATANNLPAIRQGESARAYIDRLRASINVTADTSAADRAIANATRTRTATIVVNETTGRVAGNHGGAQLGPAVGGIIRGPGTGVSDSIPAMLSNGEFVVRAAAVKKNLALLTQINGGAFVHRDKNHHYASGGYVNSGGYEGTYVSRESARAARGPAINVTELSAYDRKLLVDIADRVGIQIDTGTVSSAAATGFTRQTRRGNG